MNYSKMTKPKLLEACKEKGIEVDESMKKMDLVALLKEADENEEAITKSEEKEAVKETTSEAPEEETRDENEAKNSSSGSKRNNRNYLSKEPRRISLRGKKPFRSDGDLTVDSEDKFTQESTDEEKDDRELKLSKKNGIIQKGSIFHITDPQNYNGNVTAFAIVKKRTRKVIIPVQFLFENYEEIEESCKGEDGEVNRRELAGIIAKYLRARQGSEIDYIVIDSQTDESETKYLGSRVAAMAKKREDYWFSRQTKRDENGNYKYRINVGDRPEARIVAVSKNAMVLEVFGVEVMIRSPEVAHEFIPDLRDKYHPGMKEKVVITDIIRDGHARTVKIKGSIKAGKVDPRAEHFDDYNKNDWCLGTVTGINDGENDVSWFVKTLEDNITVLCYLNDGIDRIPEIGDKVEFRVVDKDPDSLKIWGRIKHIF